MKMNISPVERDTLLEWKESSKSKAGRFGGGEAVFPEEEQLVALLKAHKDGEIELTDNGVITLFSWAESSVDSHFGRGAITTSVEKALLDKIKKAGAELSPEGVEEGLELPAEEEAGTPEQPEDGNPGEARKRKLTVVLMVAVFLVIILTVALARHRNRPAPEVGEISGPEIFRVEFVVGSVFQKNADQWVPVNIGSEIADTDSLKTLGQSQVTMSGKRGTIKILENRLIKLSDVL